MKSGWWAINFELTLEGEEVRWDDLSDITQEHIAEKIKEGYVSGEIVEEDDKFDDEDEERTRLIKLAAKYYIAKTDDEDNGGEDIADYTVYDALYDAAMEIGMDMVPDVYDGEGYYDCLVEDVKYELGID